MSEPLFTVDCPYCSAIIPVFRDKATATCRACGGIMKLVYPSDLAYSDAKMELAQLKKVRMKK